jgi:protein phosphatase
MGADWEVAGDQIQGARRHQEDAFRIVLPAAGANAAPLVVVADGMGGHVGGAEASRTAAEAFVAALSGAAVRADAEERLEAALEQANRAIAAAVAAHPRRRGMGTTLVGVRLGAAALQWASVGDSPLWLWRDGRLLRLNADHSLAGTLREEVAQGRLTPEAAAHDPARHVLQAAVMGDRLTMRDVAAHPLVEGDIVILASDGIETLGLGDLEALLAAHRHRPAQTIVGELLDEVERRDDPHQDNATVVVAKR